MTLTLTLTTELEQRLNEESKRFKLSLADTVCQILEVHLLPQRRQAQLLALLQSWIHEQSTDAENETDIDLLSALDLDRLSTRPLFPPELQGVTW